MIRGKRRRRRTEDPFYNLEKVASATECTGLKLAPPQTPEEDRNQSELYATHNAAKIEP